MRIEIEIPKEFEEHFKQDKFEDTLHRLSADAHLIAGNYEQETAIMLIKAFKESKPAYDVEAVVAELEKIKKVSACDEIRCDECKYTKICFEGEKSYKVALDRATSIVRGKE